MRRLLHAIRHRALAVLRWYASHDDRGPLWARLALSACDRALDVLDMPRVWRLRRYHRAQMRQADALLRKIERS